MAEPVNEDGERWVESPLFGLILLLGRLLLSLLLAYWIIFVVYSIGRMVTGGPGAVVAWYAHIETGGDAVFLPHWNPVVFLLRQLLIAVITGGLWVGAGAKRRDEKRRHEKISRRT